MPRLSVSWHAGTVNISLRKREPLLTILVIQALFLALMIHLLPLSVMRIVERKPIEGVSLNPIYVDSEVATIESHLKSDELLQLLLEKAPKTRAWPPLPAETIDDY